ncbi:MULTISPECIES: hypothetical protein [Deinococcus]|nr:MULTISPECIES: hypothetical protein [Deinococcus]
MPWTFRFTAALLLLLASLPTDLQAPSWPSPLPAPALMAGDTPGTGGGTG